MQESDRGGAALRLVIALTVLVSAYLGLAWYLGRHVPSNTTVAGVHIGGKSPADAEATLKRQLASQASAPIRLEAAGQTMELDPSAAGLAIDLPATLEGLSGFSLAPADLWNHLDGGQAEDLEVSVDQDRLAVALAETAKSVDTSAQEGSITFPQGKVKVVQPVAGTRLVIDETSERIARAWPSAKPIPVAVEVVEPKVSAEEIARANSEFAAKAVAAPVKLVLDKTTLSVPPAVYAPAITMKADAQGRLVPAYDQAKLVAAVRKTAREKGLESAARDAKITFSGNKAVVVPSAPGVKVDESSVQPAFESALASPARTGTVKAAVVQPELTTAEAKKIAPKEVISTFTTYFPDNPPRTNNIKIAVRTLNGTYVGPGEQFSLNAVLGQRTAAKGYAEAPVILNGRLVKDYGGGISQVSTTTFNAAFFSGVRIEEYLPHSFYISRYPEGREATISWPDVDQKWTNDTGYGILIQAFTSGNALTVTFHGTKVWDIEAVKGPRRNIVQPKTIVDDSKGCVPQVATPGFDVTVTRIFKKNGAEVKRSTFSTHYIPEDKVTCTNP